MAPLKSLYIDVRSAYSDTKRKADHQGAFYVYYFMRPLSFYFTPFFIRLGITANQATYIGTLAGILGGVCLFIGKWAFVPAGVLIAICEVMDHVDGNLARYYKHSRYYGKFLDSIGGSMAHISWILGLSFGLGRWGTDFSLSSAVIERTGMAIFPIAGSLLVILMIFDGYMAIRKEYLQLQANQQRTSSGSTPAASGWRSIPRRINRLSSETSGPLFIFLPIFKCPDILFILVSIFSALQYLVGILRTWIKASKDLNIEKVA